MSAIAATVSTNFGRRRTMESKEIYAESVRHFLEPVLPLLDDPSVTKPLASTNQAS
jgi:hypothetical protein